MISFSGALEAARGCSHKIPGNLWGRKFQKNKFASSLKKKRLSAFIHKFD
jgi:hypothetical protein